MCAYEQDRNYGNPFRPVLTEVPAHYAGSKAADEGVRRAARGIAGNMIELARASGDEPVVFATGNRYLPAIRSYIRAEEIWQAAYPDDPDGYSRNGEFFDFLIEEVERLADEAEVGIIYPEDDNAIAVVDFRRFEYDEEAADMSETLSGEYSPIAAPIWWTVSVTSPDREPNRYRTRAATWERALADISALFPPSE